ncbi:MAG: type II toxin-antitoxin system YafQ family toxin [Dysgonamonadaceae bacterium]|jgi:mRNA interferase YafQ|nr:type II toxin-antitoxin system YafQ family toxin [Dysgonamonadaceae bacterium]MDD3356892.1 type II toxin-antitoxin system YafQ family toxin [Dysgonamonadaceae bacterium]MDD4247150.1 type II toxin-antitoxin system YafQ family toxin [Dysgonamonadaceae bacterium]MDD4606360.1 type II toxin-antitoxin system YafQ family toxin [Dysgonamonadaceae bacterium]HUI33510.1 type II toxin-antitoxin system YafQ family toxin [Dysgonamonadaceae bacterium]
MKTVKQSSQFKKDLKRIQHNPKKIEKLKTVLELLKEDGIVPPEYKPHLLVGQFKGYMKCHIEGDLLLIWIDENKDIIKLTRLGSHSELFK